MAVSPADITVGGLYVRFTEVREVIGVSRYGDVTFLSRSMMDRGRQSVTLDTRSRELFAIEAERQVSAYYRPPRSN